MLKCVDAFFGFAGVFVDEAEVVPGVGVAGHKARRFLEGGASGLELLLAEESDAEIQASDGKFRVGSEGLLKIFLRFGEFLLVHVGDAEGVVAKSFGLIAFGFGPGRGLRFSLSTRARPGSNNGKQDGRANY